MSLSRPCLNTVNRLFSAIRTSEMENGNKTGIFWDVVNGVDCMPVVSIADSMSQDERCLLLIVVGVVAVKTARSSVLIRMPQSCSP